MCDVVAMKTTSFLMTGNAETRLRDLSDRSVHLCVCSPPYFGLRNYSEIEQIGHEDTPKAYVERLVNVFREVRRVLRDDGSLYVVIGDCYASSSTYNAPRTMHTKAGWKQPGRGPNVYARRESACDNFDKAPGDYPDRDCLCGNLCDACRAAYRLGKFHNDISRASTPFVSRQVSNHEHKRFAYDLLPMSDFQGQHAHIEAAIHDLQLVSTRANEPLRDVLPTSKPKSSLPLQDDREQTTLHYAICQSCGGSFVNYVPGSSDKSIFPSSQRLISLSAPDPEQNTVYMSSIDDALPRRSGDIFSCCPCNKPTTNHKQQSRLKPKDLIGIPWRLAFALQDNGWILRQEIVWKKDSCMPESVTDRCTRQHETVFHLTKQQIYYHDWFAIAEPAAGMNEHDLTGQSYDAPGQATQTGSRRPHGSGNGYKRESRLTYADENGARGNDTPYEPCAICNARSVWTINPEPFDSQMCIACGTYFRGADYKRLPKDDKNRRTCTCGSNENWLSHFAVYPSRLVSRILRCSTPDGGCCARCETPLERIVEKGEPDAAWQKASGADVSGGYAGASRDGATEGGAQDASATKARILAGMTSKRTAGWRRTCDCPVDTPTTPAVVLDPFSGAGTTLLSAARLGRQGIGIDLKKEYHEMAVKRLRDPNAKCLNSDGARLAFVEPNAVID